MKLPERYCVI